MKKSDLEAGMIVDTRDGRRFLLVKDTSEGDIIINDNGWNRLCYYNDDLTSEFRDLDIVRVYKGKFGGFTYMLSESPLIWERKEMPTLTDAERVILKSLNTKWEYIARDVSGELYVYDTKPHKDSNVWKNAFEDDCDCLSIFGHLFQFIKYENEEPYKIEDLIRGC